LIGLDEFGSRNAEVGKKAETFGLLVFINCIPTYSYFTFPTSAFPLCAMLSALWHFSDFDSAELFEGRIPDSTLRPSHLPTFLPSSFFPLPHSDFRIPLTFFSFPPFMKSE